MYCCLKVMVTAVFFLLSFHWLSGLLWYHSIKVFVLREKSLVNEKNPYFDTLLFGVVAINGRAGRMQSCSWFGPHWLCSIDFQRVYQTVWYWLQDVSYCEIWMVHWIPWTCRERDFDKRGGDQRRQKKTLGPNKVIS